MQPASCPTANGYQPMPVDVLLLARTHLVDEPRPCPGRFETETEGGVGEDGSPKRGSWLWWEGMCVICTWSLAEEIRHFPFEMLLKRSGWLVTVMASKAERIKKKAGFTTAWVCSWLGLGIDR